MRPFSSWVLEMNEKNDLPWVRGFDPILRTLHWLLAISILSLLITSQLVEYFFDHDPYEKVIWGYHILSGYVFAGTLIARVLWGFVGPETARWKDLWHPKAWGEAIRTRKIPKRERAGHDPLASSAYLFAYSVMALMAITGLALAAVKFSRGPLAGWIGGMRSLKDVVGEPHEVGFALILGFVVLHLAALVFHMVRKDRVPQSMITGKQYLETPNDSENDR